MVNKHKEREIVQAKTSLETYKSLYHAIVTCKAQ